MSVPRHARHALVAADRLAGLTWKQIAEKYGYASADTAAATFGVTRGRLRDDPMRQLLVRVGQMQAAR